MKFTTEDIRQIHAKGLTEEKILEQVKLFKTGLPFSHLMAAAVPGNGLLQLDEGHKTDLIDHFDERMDAISIVKLVPASGAATRMFKFLFQFLKNYDPKKQSINDYINNTGDEHISKFFEGLKNFPFYDIVKGRLMNEVPDFSSKSHSEQCYLFVKTMLDEGQLDYGNYPKGLLPFHEYKNQEVSTALEEHLFESALYTSKLRPALLHFTISEQNKEIFTDEFNRIVDKVEKATGSTFEISFSYQKDYTDTIAVTPDDEPFREMDKSLLFRPSGHGALLENLNDLDADIIFIKNIDNVVVNRYKDQVARYKKVLGGLLLQQQKKVFDCLKQLSSTECNEETLQPILKFITEHLNVRMPSEFNTYSLKQQINYLYTKLHRPIRVCGMVKNEGEPGGGPFWVKDEDGTMSLQIVESAQIDLDNVEQKQILKNSTHFNPVDVVCGVRDYKGEKFNLKDYVDYNAAFITMKTQAGKELKALELPGLWNGSMANWNTIFVEVPLITFNPVKTVNDLLKETHQLK